MLRWLFGIFTLMSAPLWGINHCIVWHQVMGSTNATPGAFISTMASDDSAYTLFSLPSGQGDNDQFSITNSKELHVGSSSLSVGSYDLVIHISDGGSGLYQHECTINVVAGVSLPKISAGFYHNLLLAQDGKVYAWGDGDSGAIGFAGDRYAPTHLDAFGSEEVIDVAAHGWNSSFLTRSGQVYATGWNSNGLLGFGDTTTRLTPEVVSPNISGKRIVRIIGNTQASLFLEDNGALYGAGASQYNGFPNGQRNSPEWITSTGPLATSGVFLGKLIIGFGKTRYSMLVLCADGTMFGWGNSQGELGLGNKTRQINPVYIRNGIKRLFHSLSDTTYIVDSSDTLLVAGEGGNGQTGLGSTTDQTTHVELNIAGKTVHQINTGFHGVIAIMTDGSVYGWGTNSSRQVSRVASNTLFTPQLETTNFNGTPLGVGVGQVHSCLITSTGKIYGVGSNSTGQVGDNSTTDRTSHRLLSLDIGDVASITGEVYPSQTSVIEITTSSFNVTWNTYQLTGLEELL